MPDIPSTGPAAGWYADPADPSHERWWGGVEWTHDTRPLQAVAVPAVANVPGGRINPFAVTEISPVAFDPAPAFGQSTVALAPTGGFAAQPSAFSPQQDPYALAPAWNAQRGSVGPPPSNGIATAGLLFSIFGFAPVGIILSAVGLRRARNFEADGEAPVGRTRSRWGLGLGIASIVMSIVLTVLYVLFFQAVFAAYLQQASAQNSPVTVEQPAADSAVGGDDSYDRATYEQEVLADYTEDGETPDSITCPDAGSTTAGSTVTCTIVVGTRTDTRTTAYYEDGGYMMSTSSVIQQ